MNNMKELCIYVPIELEILQCEKYSKLYAIIICYSCPHVKQIYLSTKTVHIILRNKLAVLPKISSSDSVKYWHIIKFKNCIVLKLHSRLWYFFDKLSIIAVIFLVTYWPATGCLHYSNAEGLSEGCVDQNVSLYKHLNINKSTQFNKCPYMNKCIPATNLNNHHYMYNRSMTFVSLKTSIQKMWDSEIHKNY